MGVAAFRQVLGRCQVVGLDTMVFIYQFEDHPRFAPLTYELFEAIEQGRLTAQVSVLLAGEVLTGPKLAGDEMLLLHYRHILGHYPNLELQPVTMPVVELMSDLRAHYSLRTPDAIHLATALLHGAQAFVTNDRHLAAVEEEGIEIIVLSDLLTD